MLFVRSAKIKWGGIAELFGNGCYGHAITQSLLRVFHALALQVNGGGALVCTFEFLANIAVAVAEFGGQDAQHICLQVVIIQEVYNSGQ